MQFEQGAILQIPNHDTRVQHYLTCIIPKDNEVLLKERRFRHFRIKISEGLNIVTHFFLKKLHKYLRQKKIILSIPLFKMFKWRQTENVKIGFVCCFGSKLVNFLRILSYCEKCDKRNPHPTYELWCITAKEITNVISILAQFLITC